MFLEKIKKIKTAELNEAKSPKRDVFGYFSKKDFNLIAEIKKASPSKGDINLDIDIIKTANSYLEAGASAISILTEKEFFKGDIEYLKEVRNNFQEAILLRKDFIFDPYQIYEAKFAGADMVLIILAFAQEKTKELIACAKSLGLEALLEVHSEEEMKRALDLDVNFIGINNRNLGTLDVSLEVSRKLSKYISKDKIFITESGLNSAQDIAEMRALGYKGALVGTHFMQSDNLEQALKDILS